MAVLLGILFVATIRPGHRDEDPGSRREDNLIDPVDALLDLIRYETLNILHINV